jgi:hypothetical protein
MTTRTMPVEVLAQMSGRAVEMFSLWADVNQKVLRELVDLSATTAREGVRLYAELLSCAVEGARDGQALMVERQREMREAPQDIVGFCQRSLLASVEGAQEAWRMLEGGAQAIMRSAERLQVTAEEAGKEIQTTFTQLAGKAQSLYTAA